jgi:polyhydroxyalkanoate synthesis repressor PhaR
MNEIVVLKKYANRRLYDTEKSVYVTLQEVAEVIRRGRRVQVVDAQTKEDVSAFILTQIILEEAKNKNALLPVPLLHLIIQFGDNVLVEFFERYLQQIIQSYLVHKAAFEEQFKQWIDTGLNLSEISRRSMPDVNGLRRLFEINPFLKPIYPNEAEDEGPDKDREI